MIPEDLQTRVSTLEKAVATFSEELRLALRYIPSDAGSSLTKSRIILERLVIQIYVTEMGHEPKKPMLGDMLLENQFTHKIERRILSRMNAIRDMGNLGPHGESVEASDAARVLDDLCEVLDWFLQRYQLPVAAHSVHEPAILQAALVDPEREEHIQRAAPKRKAEEVPEVLPVPLVEEDDLPKQKPTSRWRWWHNSLAAGLFCGAPLVLAMTTTKGALSESASGWGWLVCGVFATAPGLLGGAVNRASWAWGVAIGLALVLGLLALFAEDDRLATFGLFAWIGGSVAWVFAAIAAAITGTALFVYKSAATPDAAASAETGAIRRRLRVLRRRN
jgi:hypothetical protein